MWCEINRGGVRRGGGNSEGKTTEKECIAPQGANAPAFLQTFKSEPSTTTEETLPQYRHIHAHARAHTIPVSVSQHPQNSCQLPLDPSGGSVCVCVCVGTLTACHAFTVCVWKTARTNGSMLLACGRQSDQVLILYFSFLSSFEYPVLILVSKMESKAITQHLCENDFKNPYCTTVISPFQSFSLHFA